MNSIPTDTGSFVKLPVPNGQVVGLSPPEDATAAEVTVEGLGVRYRMDSNPTTTEGMPLAIGQNKLFKGMELKRVRFISTGLGSTLNVYFTK